MADVYIIGSYSTRFQKWPDKSFKDLTREAYLGVLGDSGLENGADIEITYFGNCGLGTWSVSRPWCVKACFRNAYPRSTLKMPAPHLLLP